MENWRNGEIEGEELPLNEWDRPERAGERARQRCYRRKDKWRTIDVNSRMWERATGKEGGSGDTEQTWSQRRFLRLRADCDVLTTQSTGQFPHSTVELMPNKLGIYSKRSAVGSRIINHFQEKNI